MAKEKKRNYEDTAKSELLSDETRNALLGILVFLLAIIGLVETAGPLGKIIRYFAVYFLGTFSSIILVMLALLGIYVFIKRKFPKIKVKLSLGAIISLFIFSLIYSSENDWTLVNTASNYRDIFDSISQEGYISILTSSVAGGFVGHLLYALLSTFVGGVGAQIICVVFIIGSIAILLQPIVYYIGSKFVIVSSKVEQKNKMRRKDKEVRPSLIYDVPQEELLNMNNEGYKFVDDEIKVQEEIQEQKENTPIKKSKIRRENSFDIFNNNYNFGNNNNEPIIKNNSRKFDIFNDTLFEERKFREEKIEINNQNLNLNNYEFNNIKEERKVNNFFESYNELNKPVEEEDKYQTNDEVYSSEVKDEIDRTINDIYNSQVNNEVVEEENSLDYQVNTNDENIKDDKQNVFSFFNSKKDEEKFTIEAKEEKQEEKQEEKIEKKKIEKPFKNFILPSLALLDEPQNHQEAENRSNAERKGILLNKKLESLGIKARVVNYRISASFTRYEISLDPNSKITQFNNISQDLMMALSAEKVNVLAPIPGSEYIGVEIPNIVRSPVSLKETLVGTITYSTPPLLTTIGKDGIGEIISFDLAKTPHLLVAGSTGSGKSVCMNAIIMSLLMHNSPNDLKLILIDPKRVEFSAYADIPHLACPVITEVGKAGMALSRLVEFMNDRYKILQNVNAKNIEVYNKLMERQGKDKMEYYVCIVDELADLFMNVKSAENSIKEITQLSRAVGIHMIVATQRPSVDIITGTIKNNIPSRIAFAVTTGADSRTILDSVGAENLLGRGDMLVNIAGKLSMTRGQGCNVTDDEIERVVDFIKKQGSPVFNPRFLDLDPPKPQAEEISNSGTPEDDLVNEIIAYMSMGNHVSTTKIQTKFNIGYPRAARIIERLSEANMIYRDPQTKQWALNENTLNTDE